MLISLSVHRPRLQCQSVTSNPRWVSSTRFSNCMPPTAVIHSVRMNLLYTLEVHTYGPNDKQRFAALGVRSSKPVYSKHPSYQPNIQAARTTADRSPRGPVLGSRHDHRTCWWNNCVSLYVRLSLIGKTTACPTYTALHSCINRAYNYQLHVQSIQVVYTSGDLTVSHIPQITVTHQRCPCQIHSNSK